MKKHILITIEGPQGSGKTYALNTLRKAGWYVSEERAIGDGNNRITAMIGMPEKELDRFECPVCGDGNNRITAMPEDSPTSGHGFKQHIHEFTHGENQDTCMCGVRLF